MFGIKPCGKRTEVGTLRWVALGDSLTVGFGVIPEQSYPNQVLEKSRNSLIPLELVKNLANGGHTLARVQLLQLSRLGLYKPDVVSLWVGTNDAILHAALGKRFDLASQETLPTPVESFERRFEEVIKKLEKLEVKEVFVGKLHDLSLLPVADGWDKEKKQAVKSIVDSYNALFDSFSKKYAQVSLVPLDQVEPLVNRSLYLQDGIHPKSQVYEAVASAFWRVMQERLKGLSL